MCVYCLINLKGKEYSYPNSDLSVSEEIKLANKHLFDKTTENVAANASVSTIVASSFAYIDGLLMGAKWGSNDLTFTITESSSDLSYSLGSYSFNTFNDSQRTFTRKVMEAFDNVSGLSITEVANSNPSVGTLQFYESNFAGATARVVDFPDGSLYGVPTADWNGDVVFNHSDYNSPQFGDYAGLNFFHEVGHAVGLSHGHFSQNGFGTLESSRDSLEYSVMTYRSYINGPTSGYTNDQGSFPSTLMQSDIAALQYLYGANFNYNSEDNTYTWNPSTGMMYIDGAEEVGAASYNTIFMTIWDGGGNDTYDLSNYTSDLSINLEPAGGNVFSTSQLAYLGYSNRASANVFNAYLYQGNTASLIENATGGSGNDTIIGNVSDNILDGGDGNDTLNGQAGDDNIIGGAGDDNLNGGDGSDTASYTVATGGVAVNLSAGSATSRTGGDAGIGTDTLSAIENVIGGDHADLIVGDENDNILTGGNGDDTITGAGGTDTVSYELATASVYVDLSTGSATSRTGSDASIGTDILSTIENVIGSNYDDIIKGDSNSNTLSGSGGHDVFFGGNSEDDVSGGDGNDFILLEIAHRSATTATATLVSVPDYSINLDSVEGKAFLDVNLSGSFQQGALNCVDTTGDGRVDIIMETSSHEFYFSAASGSGASGGLGEATIGLEHGGPDGFIENQVQFCDINGDGRYDSIFQGLDNRFWANFGTETGFTGARFVAQHGGTFNPAQVQYADTNGDNRIDMIFHGLDNRFWVGLGEANGFSIPKLAAIHGGPFNPDQVQYADINGDGLADLLYQGIDNIFWADLGTSTGEFVRFGQVAQHGGPFRAGQVQYADVNADSKADLVFQGVDNRFWVQFGGDNGFGNPTLAATILHDDFNIHQWQLSDMNGDGARDLMYQGDNNAVWYYASNSDGTFSTGRMVANFSGEFIRESIGYGDLNGDNLGDIIYQDSNNDVWTSLQNYDWIA